MDVIDTLSVDCTPLSTEISQTFTSQGASQTVENSRSAVVTSVSTLNAASSSSLLSSSSIARSDVLATPISTDTKSTPSQRKTPLSSPSSTQVPESPNGSQQNTNLSKAGEIALGSVIPAVGVIVAVIFGVKQWNQRRPNERGERMSWYAEAFRRVASITEHRRGVSPIRDREISWPLEAHRSI